jgi:hypothetical protein
MRTYDRQLNDLNFHYDMQVEHKSFCEREGTSRITTKYMPMKDV